MGTTTKISEIRNGDIFSEISHYIVDGVTKEHVLMKHTGSGQTVKLSHTYVQDLLNPADQYHQEIIVGKEDKFWTQLQIDIQHKKDGFGTDPAPRAGDLKLRGIRTIWEEIHSAQVFSVAFKKADEPLSAKKHKELLEKQRDEAVAKIIEIKEKKKGVANEAGRQIDFIQANPVLPFIEGEIRKLRGYKQQFVSRDGKYMCMDMDINEPRPVNINTIQWLVFAGVKYVLEK